MRDFSIKFAKNKAKQKRQKLSVLENMLKRLEQNINNEEMKSKFEVNVNGMNSEKNQINFFLTWKNLVQNKIL